jgi:hypothetical protein
MESPKSTAAVRPHWNKGNLIGQKTPLKLKEIWAIRVHLQLAERRGNSPCSIWPLTANFEPVTS